MDKFFQVIFFGGLTQKYKLLTSIYLFLNAFWMTAYWSKVHLHSVIHLNTDDSIVDDIIRCLTDPKAIAAFLVFALLCIMLSFLSQAIFRPLVYPIVYLVGKPLVEILDYAKKVVGYVDHNRKPYKAKSTLEDVLISVKIVTVADGKLYRGKFYNVLIALLEQLDNIENIRSLHKLINILFATLVVFSLYDELYYHIPAVYMALKYFFIYAIFDFCCLIWVKECSRGIIKEVEQNEINRIKGEFDVAF